VEKPPHQSLDLASDFLQRLNPPRGEHDTGPLSREFSGRRLADAAARTGDHCHFAVQSTVDNARRLVLDLF
jgi:hypothetical protein